MKIPYLLLTAMLIICGCTPSPQGDQAPVETAAEDSGETQVELNLSRELLQDTELDDADIAEDPALLDDMFEAERDEKRVKLSGSVLTDEEASELTERVEGAEVKVEIKTK
ncbi:MAG: hypothetical protein AAF513_13495 [Pseudomonadota bacterium]